MKTTRATTDPAPPLVKYVADTWHRAHQTGARVISLHLENGEFKMDMDSEDWNPPPASLFRHMVKEFLRYAGIRVWPWTKTVVPTTCRVEAGDCILTWTMSSENVSKVLMIRRD